MVDIAVRDRLVECCGKDNNVNILKIQNYDGELSTQSVFINMRVANINALFYKIPTSSNVMVNFTKNHDGVFEYRITRAHDVIYKFYVPVVKSLKYIKLYKGDETIATVTNTNTMTFKNLFLVSVNCNYHQYRFEYEFKDEDIRLVDLSLIRTQNEFRDLYRPQIVVGMFDMDIRESIHSYYTDKNNVVKTIIGSNSIKKIIDNGNVRTIIDDDNIKTIVEIGNVKMVVDNTSSKNDSPKKFDVEEDQILYLPIC